MSEQGRPKIAVIGSLNMDIVVEVARSPSQGETILDEKVHIIPSGKGANQAFASARLEAYTMMIGSLGADEFGKSLRTSLQKEQVDISGIKRIDDVQPITY